MKRLMRVAQYALIAAGTLALGYCAMVYFHQWHFQQTESRLFDQNLVKRATIPKNSPDNSPNNGTVLGRLEIRRIGLTAMVVEGAEDGNLREAAGHIRGTALPGQAGNVAIAAHRDTLFRPLRRVRKSDLVVLSTLQGAYRYRVVSTQVVGPEAVQVLYPTANDSLTLVTCFPFDYIGSAPKRFVVRALRVDE